MILNFLNITNFLNPYIAIIVCVILLLSYIIYRLTINNKKLFNMISDLNKKLSGVDQTLIIKKLEFKKYFMLYKSLISILKSLNANSIIIYNYRYDHNMNEIIFNSVLQMKNFKGRYIPILLNSDNKSLNYNSFSNLTKHNTNNKGLIYIDDIKKIEHYYTYTYKIMRKDNIRSFYAKNLEKNGSVLGIMIVTFKKPRELSESEVKYFKKISKIISETI